VLVGFVTRRGMKYSSFPWIIAIKVYSPIGDLAPAGVTAEKEGLLD